MVIITNKGLIDPLAFELIGASTKRDDEQTIGFFGSGVKYAIAGLLKRGIPFQVWRGTEPIEFTTEKVVMRDTEFDRILIDGKPTSMTTSMGPKWELWMLVRELYANAIDEGGEMAVTDDYSQFIREDHTTFIFPDRVRLQEVIGQQEFLFARNREIIYEDERIRVYEDVGRAGYYVKGIYVGGEGNGHGYMIKDHPYAINEERKIENEFWARLHTLERITKISCPKTIKKIVSRAKVQGTIEYNIFHGYLNGSVKTSEAWAEVMLFPADAKEFATEWNHLPVSEDVYKLLDHPNKWTRRKWDPSGTEEQNKKLNEAMGLVRMIDPGVCAGMELMFAQSSSKALGMGFEDGVMYVSADIAGEPTLTIAAHLTMMLSENHPTLGLRAVTAYFRSLQIPQAA